jgi:hypothetical protein
MIQARVVCAVARRRCTSPLRMQLHQFESAFKYAHLLKRNVDKTH